MFKYTTLSYLFLFSLSLYANTSKKETKIQLADSLLDMTSETMINVDIEKTLELSSQALIVSSEAKYAKGMIRSLFVIGQALFHNQNYNEALDYLSRADKIKDHQKYPLYMTQIYKVRGQFYFYLQMKEQSLKELNRALNMAKDVEPNNYRVYLTSQIYESFIVIYGADRDETNRFHYLQLNKDLLESVKDESFIFSNKINAYSLLGEYYIQNNELDSALAALDRALELIEKYNFKYTSRTLRHVGDALALKGAHREALNNYMDAITNASELGLEMELTPLHDKAANLYEIMNMPDSAAYHESQKVIYENKTLHQKVSSTDNALQILIDGEKKSTKSRWKRILIVTVFVVLIFGYFIVKIILKRRHKVIIEEAEVETQQLKRQLNTAFEDVFELAKNNDPTFLTRFQEVYPDFWKVLISKHADLTNTDLQLCALTYLNFSTADIAQYTFVEPRTVQTRRSRLRKKINLDSEVDLYYYLKTLSL